MSNKYVSHIKKRNFLDMEKYIKQNKLGEIVLNKASQSNYTRPCYFVLKESKNKYCIIVRGTVNSFDSVTDMNVNPHKLEYNEETFYVHEGFFKLAQHIYLTMD